jgi:hypothetical protein
MLHDVFAVPGEIGGDLSIVKAVSLYCGASGSIALRMTRQRAESLARLLLKALRWRLQERKIWHLRLYASWCLALIATTVFIQCSRLHTSRLSELRNITFRAAVGVVRL